MWLTRYVPISFTKYWNILVWWQKGAEPREESTFGCVEMFRTHPTVGDKRCSEADGFPGLMQEGSEAVPLTALT